MLSDWIILAYQSSSLYQLHLLLRTYGMKSNEDISTLISFQHVPTFLRSSVLLPSPCKKSYSLTPFVEGVSVRPSILTLFVHTFELKLERPP